MGIVKGQRPLCKFCAERIPVGSFAWVKFPTGATYLMHYCTRCKQRAGSPVKHYLLDAFNLDPNKLPTLEAECYKGTDKVKHAQEDEGKNAKQYAVEQLKRMPYKDYLQTAHWKLIAEKVKRRAKRRCQLCNSEGMLHVHHRTYERKGEELLKDLICLCEHCHAKFHDKLPKER